VLLSAGYGFLTHYAMRLLGHIPPEARAWCGINEFVTGILVGQGFTKTDSSFLASYGGFDPVTLRFNNDFAAYANGDNEKKIPFSYPCLAAPFSIAGTTPDGVPVAHPVGDNQASFYGLVARPEEECLISIGTSGQMSVFSKSGECPLGMELRPFLGLGYIFVGATISAGKSYEVLERFCADIVQRYAKEKGLTLPPKIELFETIKAAALERENKNDNGLIVDTAFNGTRQDKARRGSITGITLNNLTVGNLTAATVAGIVRELAAFRTRPGIRFKAIKRIVTAGNAIKNPLFRQELENQFQAEICATSGLGAALGSVLIGGVSAGLIKQDDVCNIILALRTNKS
jgi:sedoheptulokinase